VHSQTTHRLRQARACLLSQVPQFFVAELVRFLLRGMQKSKQATDIQRTERERPENRDATAAVRRRRREDAALTEQRRPSVAHGRNRRNQHRPTTEKTGQQAKQRMQETAQHTSYSAWMTSSVLIDAGTWIAHKL
jgi:type IV secretory pathway VirB10-like protein